MMQTFTFQLEDGGVLETGHRIHLAGLQCGAFSMCPTIMWGHTKPDRPIGRGVRLWREEDRVLLEVELAPSALCPTAVVVAWLVRVGQVTGISGWYVSAVHQPNAYGGLDLETCELAEVSILPEPYNPRSRLLSPVPDPTAPKPPKKYWALSDVHDIYDREGLARWVRERPCVVEGLSLDTLGWTTQTGAPI